MSLFKKIFLAIILFLGVLSYLLYSSNGLHLLINGAVRLIPGLKIESISGSWCDFTIKKILYRVPGAVVSANNLHLAIDFGCLRHRQLFINDLSLSNVALNLNTDKLESLGMAERRVPDNKSLFMFYHLILRHLELDNIRIRVNNTSIILDKLITGFQLYNNNLTVTPTRIYGLLVILPMKSEKSEIRTPERVVSSSKSTLIDALRTSLLGKPLLPPLPSFTMPLSLTITNVNGENLHLIGDEIDLPITNLHLQAATQDQHIKITLLDISSQHWLLNATGHAELRGRYPVKMVIITQLNNDLLKGEKIKLTVWGELCDELHIVLNTSGSITTLIKLKARLLRADLPMISTFDKNFLKWPLTSALKHKSSSVTLQVGEEVRVYQSAINAKGNNGRFLLSRLRLAALSGNTDLSTVINWQKSIGWRGELLLNIVNTAQRWPHWPTWVEGKIPIRCSLHSSDWQLQVPKLYIRSIIHQKTLNAKGSLCGNSAGQWQIPQLMLEHGRNQLTVNGKLNNSFASLDAVLRASELNSILLGLGGRIAGNIKLRSNLLDQQLVMDLGIHALHWRETNIARLALKANVNSGDIVRGNVQLRLNRLRYGETLSIAQLTMDVAGNEKQHQLKLSMQGKPIMGQLRLNGSFDRQKQHWQGTMSMTKFDTPIGEWSLTRALKMDYRAMKKTLIIGPHCWQGSSGQICVSKNIYLGTSGYASIFLNRFSLAKIKSILPVEIQTNGTLTGQASIRWDAGGRSPCGKMVLIGDGLKIGQTIQGNKLPIVFETLTINATLDRDLMLLDWWVKLADNGQFNGHMQITDLQRKRRLCGTININNFSLALLKPLLPQCESISGLINASLRLEQDIKQPQIYGQMQLDRLIIKDIFMPFMTKSKLVLSFNGTHSTLHGIINTIHGQTNLTGYADWSKIKAWHAYINVQGNLMRITVPPIVQLNMSPDVVFEATPMLLSIYGKLDIPWARIEIRDIPQNAIQISSDEVLLDDNLQPIPNKSRISDILINSNLFVHIGPDVRLNAFGLKASLIGALRLTNDKQGPLLNGQVDIPFGRFQAYGQDLIVNNGQLLFSGPIYQPYLNIEAIRNPDLIEDNVIAGVRVTGLTDQLRVEVFSDPVKSQQETLSYLLRGQGLEVSGADSNMMASMLIGLGVSQSRQVMNKIGQAFGISDFALDTRGVGNNSQIVVSGYIAPGLQVKYGFGILDSLATLTLRYRLMPKLYLEAVSGLNQALDLLYRFEF